MKSCHHTVIPGHGFSLWPAYPSPERSGMVCAERHARLEPLLQAIYDFLDKQPALVEQVRRDLKQIVAERAACCPL